MTPVIEKARSLDKEQQIIEAWIVVWNRWSYRLQCRNYTVEEREDMLAQATARAILAIPFWEKRSSLKTYLFKVFQHSIFNDIRQRRIRRLNRAKAEWAIENWGIGLSYALHQNENYEAIHQALAKMNPRKRHILVLRELEGRSYDTISMILNIPRGTVMSRLNTSRLAFRDTFFRLRNEN